MKKPKHKVGTKVLYENHTYTLKRNRRVKHPLAGLQDAFVCEIESPVQGLEVVDERKLRSTQQ